MFVGMNREGEPMSVSGGRYVDRFERRDGRWAIAARVCVRDWAPVRDTPDMADPSTLTAIQSTLTPEVRAFMLGSGLPRRDHGDRSYDRPLEIAVGRLSGP